MIIMVIISYLAVIGWINFRGDPRYFVTDMYSDIMYAQTAWNEKTVLPQNWIFGNQLYAAATPNIASVFYGITGDPITAMGLASTFMTLVLIVSFGWMLRSMNQSWFSVGVGVISLLTITLFCGNPIKSKSGWQLWFTLCSYYSCYAITAFLCYGCYLRSDCRSSLLMIGLSGMLSFAMGIQSLRQTLIMSIPLAAVECIEIVRRRWMGQKILNRSTATAAILIGSNLLGVVSVKLLSVNSVHIYGDFSFVSLREIPYRIRSGIELAMSLFSSSKQIEVCILFVLTALLIISLVQSIRKDNQKLLAIILHFMSVGTVLAVHIVSTMIIQQRYFFMIVPFAAVMLSVVFENLSVRMQKTGTITLTVLSLVLLLFRGSALVRDYPKTNAYKETSQFLLNNGITTVYSRWNLGQYYAIASDFRLEAGFWGDRKDIFRPVLYLTDTQIYDRKAETVAYLFDRQDEVELAKELSGGILEEFSYIPDLNLWICRADKNLMDGSAAVK